MNLLEIFSILLIHWFADFVLQTDKQAKGKSKNWSDLIAHTKMYSFVWLIVGSMYLYISYQTFSPPRELCINVVYFTLITFVTHTITDYFTSRLNSKLIPKTEILASYPEYFKYKKDSSWYLFFVSIGFDQILHYIQLFLTYYLLKTI